MREEVERKLHWKPIENAPHKQKVLIWKDGDFFAGRVLQVGNGGYEVEDDEGGIVLSAIHYALVEGP